MHNKKVIYSGKKIGEAKKALILLHGRGADARDILSIARYLNVDAYSLVAPEATGSTWYPNSFLAPPQLNEPWLSSALDLLGEVVQELEVAGIGRDNIYFAGFSQGACLSLEFMARNAGKWGGVVAFTGG